MGYTRLGRVQLASEGGTPGTAISTATVLLPVYKAAWQEINTVDQPEELRGSLAKYFRGDILGRQAVIDVEADVTFEDLPYYCNMAIKSATGTSDSGGTPAYSYVYAPTLTAADDPLTSTVQVGDDTSSDAFYAPYVFARTLEISAAIEQRTRLKTQWVGQFLTAQAFTGALSRTRSIESAVGQNWTLYADDAGGTMGNTAFTGVLTGFTFSLPSCYEPHKSINGSLYYQVHKATPWCPELSLTVEVDSGALGLRTNFRAGQRKLFRLRNVGTTIHSGTPVATAAKRIDLEGAFRITEYGVVGGAENMGVQTVQIKAMGEFDATYNKLFQITVVNALSALA